jgi:hypothetical protein
MAPAQRAPGAKDEPCGAFGKRKERAFPAQIMAPQGKNRKGAGQPRAGENRFFQKKAAPSRGEKARAGAAGEKPGAL